jgi:7-cyano-7-deazaguanine synthase in queuosine biosynthesis
MSPEAVLQMLEDRKYVESETNFFRGTNSQSINYALLLKEYLKVKEDLEIETIVSGITANDGIMIRRQTLTYIREQLLQGVTGLGDLKLQVYSLFFDKETRIWMDKTDICRLGISLGIPMEKTYSCYFGKKIHCGTCLACSSRKSTFKRLGVIDKTEYLDTSVNLMIHLIRRLKVKIKNAREKIRKTRGY